MSRRFKFLTVGLLLLLAWILVAPFLAEILILEKKLPRADAILILAGSSVYRERTRKAAALYQSGIAPKIYLSDDGERGGWSRVEQRNVPFVELAKGELIRQGVPPESIKTFKAAGSGTIYEAEEFQKIARGDNLKSVLLVTSAYHTRRAFRTFQNVSAPEEIELGIEFAPPGEQTPLPYLWWLSPFGWKVVAGEYVKSAYYWICY